MQEAMEFSENLKYMGPTLNSLSLFSENLTKPKYTIENSGRFWNAYYFSYVRGYKTALTVGNNV